MPSITIWTRLEPDTGPSPQGYTSTDRDRLLFAGTQACVHDPLWLLGRQWQFGEFQGEDAGSPIQADVRVESSPLTAYSPSLPVPGSHSVAQVYARDAASNAPLLPLEALVEREQVRVDERASVRLAAEAGLHLGRLFVEAGLGRYRTLFAAAFAFSPVPADQLDPASAAFQSIVTGRTANGAAIHGHLRTLNPRGATGPFVFPDRPVVAPADRAQVADVLRRWLRWYEDEVFSEPAAATPWTAERMEYRFAVGAPPLPGQRETVLVAPSYRGELEWHTFDCLDTSNGTSLGATGTAQTLPVLTVIPTAVRYPGMPSSRYWEFEDARVDLGAVEAQPDDLARLLLVEFALLYGNDWFLIPLEFVTGTLCRVASLVVVDTFGQRRRVATATEGEPGRRSRLFRLAIPGTDITGDALFLPPVSGAVLESPSIEQVRFARDETANLMWAIERSVESETGRPLDLRRSQPAPPPSIGIDSASLEYRPMSTVPRNWIPLVPARPTAPPPTQLILGAVLNDGVVQMPSPRGRVVPPDISLAAEEVPREGIDVARLFRYTRWVDGSTHLWAARRRRPASGEAASAVGFDFLAAPR